MNNDIKYIVVGLGNPEPERKDTRHNVGWMMLDHLATAYGVEFNQDEECNALIARPHGMMLVKPTCGMNSSGEALAAIYKKYQPNKPELLIIYDDTTLPFGKISLRSKVSHSKHNGLRSIESYGIDLHANGAGYWMRRLRIGIGNPAPGVKMLDHVLGDFTENERDVIIAMSHLVVDIVDSVDPSNTWNREQDMLSKAESLARFWNAE